MKTVNIIVLILLISNISKAQSIAALADSIRTAYHIPELGYAVVSLKQVNELQVSGVRQIGTTRTAMPEDRFRIGSNTKAITGFIAAQLVKEGTIHWDTKFFDLFPELKTRNNRAFHNLTLLRLLSFRTNLYPYTYTYPEPAETQFKGTYQEQRLEFAAWFFKQKPVAGKDSFHFSNLGYIAAGLMLERASGKQFKDLVDGLGARLGVSFGFGQPNFADSTQPWGHDMNMLPEAPGNSVKLEWLQAAGNINIGLPDYSRFIQLQLQGLNGNSDLLSKQEFNFLHFGLNRFAVGWFNSVDENGRRYSYNTGNPGTFLTRVYVFPDSDKALILFCNVQSPEAEAAFEILYQQFRQNYLGQ